MSRRTYSAAFWDAIEQEHVYNGQTFEVLSQKYGVSQSAISYQSKRRSWPEKREIQRRHVNGALVSTRNAMAKLTQKLDTLDPMVEEDVKEWDKLMKQISTLALNVKRVEGSKDFYGDVLGAMRTFKDFLEPRCQDKDFMTKLCDWMEQWVLWVQKQ